MEFTFINFVGFHFSVLRYTFLSKMYDILAKQANILPPCDVGIPYVSPLCPWCSTSNLALCLWPRKWIHTKCALVPLFHKLFEALPCILLSLKLLTFKINTFTFPLCANSHIHTLIQSGTLPHIHTLTVSYTYPNTSSIPYYYFFAQCYKWNTKHN